MNAEMRDFAIRDIGCIASALWAEKQGIVRGPVPCEKHHLNAHDMPGGKRRGEKHTVGLSQWSHVGRCLCTGAITDCLVCKAAYGPSWRHHKREFLETFGSGDELLAEQDKRIAAWRGNTIGGMK